VLEGGVVEAVDIVPDYNPQSVFFFFFFLKKSLKGIGELTANLLILVLSILNPSHEDGRLVGENQSIWRKVLISCVQYRI